MFNILRLSFSKSQFKVYKGYLIPRPPQRLKSSPLDKKQHGDTSNPEAANLSSEQLKESFTERLKKERAEYKQKTQEYNKNWIGKFKNTQSTYQRFVHVRLAQIKKSGLFGMGAYEKTLKQWSQLSPEQKKKYEPDQSQLKKDMESLKDYKIPDLKGKSELSLDRKSQQVREFCKKHGITVDELDTLIKEANIEKGGKEPQQPTKQTKAKSIKKKDNNQNEKIEEGKSDKRSQQPSTTKTSSTPQSINQRDQIRSAVKEFIDMR